MLFRSVEDEQNEATADATVSQADEGATDGSKAGSGDAAEAAEQDVATAEKADSKDARDAYGSDEDERARVEAAIRAGEQAAERDFKSDVERLRQERDELKGRLDSVARDIMSAQQREADAAARLVRLQADW